MSILAAGYFNDQVTILWPTWARGATYDEQLATWETSKKVKANVQFNRGAAAINVAEQWMQRQIAVTVRYHKSIHDRCRLQWHGQTYRIVSLHDDPQSRSINIVAVTMDEAAE